MPKASEVSYYESRNGYYAWIAGKQTRLAKGPKDEPSGPTYLAALRRFAEEMELAAVGKPGEDITIKALFEVYFRDHAADLAPKSVLVRQDTAKQFMNHFPGLLAGQITPDHIATFLRDGRARGMGTAKSKPWSETTAKIRRDQLAILLRWGTDEGWIKTNLFPRKGKMKLRSRARDRIVTPEEHERVMTFLNHYTRRHISAVIIALENTGARISELVSARVRDWRDDVGAIVYHSDQTRRPGEHRHKNAAKKDRVIFFTGEALKMVRWLIEERKPEDPIFRNKYRRPYTVQVVAQQFCKIQKETGLKHVSAHAYRHAFATRWLQRDGNIDALAECLGNTPETIRKTYAHLLTDMVGLRAKLESVMRPCTEIRP